MSPIRQFFATVAAIISQNFFVSNAFFDNKETEIQCKFFSTKQLFGLELGFEL